MKEIFTSLDDTTILTPDYTTHENVCDCFEGNTIWSYRPLNSYTMDICCFYNNDTKIGEFSNYNGSIKTSSDWLALFDRRYIVNLSELKTIELKKSKSSYFIVDFIFSKDENIYFFDVSRYSSYYVLTIGCIDEKLESEIKTFQTSMISTPSIDMKENTLYVAYRDITDKLEIMSFDLKDFEEIRSVTLDTNVKSVRIALTKDYICCFSSDGITTDIFIFNHNLELIDSIKLEKYFIEKSFDKSQYQLISTDNKVFIRLRKEVDLLKVVCTDINTDEVRELNLDTLYYVDEIPYRISDHFMSISSMVHCSNLYRDYFIQGDYLVPSNSFSPDCRFNIKEWKQEKVRSFNICMYQHKLVLFLPFHTVSISHPLYLSTCAVVFNFDFRKKKALELFQVEDLLLTDTIKTIKHDKEFSIVCSDEIFTFKVKKM